MIDTLLPLDMKAKISYQEGEEYDNISG